MTISNDEAPSFLRSPAASLLALGILVLAMYGPVLFSGTRVLSQPGTDLTAGEADGKLLWAEALREGQIPQWNPHVYSGIPMLGDLQAGVLYPLNLLFLLFPFVTALNLHVAVHVWIIGAGMFFWIRYRGIHPAAAFVAAGMVMFAGPVSLHVYAGHWANLAAMAWAPLLFLAADRIFQNEFRKGILLGSAVLAIQILTGQVQYVYYTGIALGIYSVLRLLTEPPRLRKLASLAAFAAGGIALSAVQLLPGILNLRDSARGGAGVSYDFAAMFSFPPENIVTLIAPGFFGNMTAFPYWGRCYLWEMCLFFSVTGLAVGLYGFIKGPGNQRRWSGVMVAVLFVLALGSHTPLFPILFEYAPGFKSLRGNSKFIFPGLLFAGMLVAVGLNALLHGTHRLRGWGAAMLAAAALAGIAGLTVSSAAGAGWWQDLMGAVFRTGESYVPESFYTGRETVAGASGFAANSLFWAGGTLAAAGLILLFPMQARVRLALLGILIVGEVFSFARSSRVSFDLEAYRKETGQAGIRDFLAKNPGDYRILQLQEPNSAIYLKAQNIWGYGAVPSRRYLEFIAFTQGIDPDRTTQYVDFTRWPEIYRMLRCRFGFVPGAKQIQVLTQDNPLARLHLLENYELLADRDTIFSRLLDPAFDPLRTVILEAPPGIAAHPGNSPKGHVRLVRSSVNQFEIEADAPGPCILLMTDPYTKALRVKALPDSSQQSYHTMPANYVLTAIPLQSGSHHLILEYSAAGYQTGKWITFASLAGWGGLLWLPGIIRRRHRGKR